MNEEQASKQAQEWWGKHGKAVYVPYHSTLGTELPGRYIVGLTALPAHLGGRIASQFGTSRLSFEAAFRVAIDYGHGPVIDEWEEDEDTEITEVEES